VTSRVPTELQLITIHNLDELKVEALEHEIMGSISSKGLLTNVSWRSKVVLLLRHELYPRVLGLEVLARPYGFHIVVLLVQQVVQLERRGVHRRLSRLRLPFNLILLHQYLPVHLHCTNPTRVNTTDHRSRGR
jgi:hypothetical protein